MSINGTCLMQLAREYLVRVGATNEMIDCHIYLWRGNARKVRDGGYTLEQMYRSMLQHAKNRQRMPNVIGDVDRLKKALCCFSPGLVLDKYGNYREILNAFQNTGVVEFSVDLDFDNPRSLWVIYAKSILSCAKFINDFQSVREFNDFVDKFSGNVHAIRALPLLLKEEIFGFGFALACDFLKENGYENYIKPDVHINYISREIGLTEEGSDYGVFKDVVSYAIANNIVPYELDKIFWLIGSGNFYLCNRQVTTNRDHFAQLVLGHVNLCAICA